MPVPQLETFDAGTAATPAVVVTDQPALDALRTAAWAEGYQTGRDEARLSAASAEAESRATLAAHLTQLTLTADDVRRQTLAALEAPLLTLITRLLPVISHETLAPLILEQIAPLMEEAAGAPLILHTHPQARVRLGEIIASAGYPDLLIREDPQAGPDDAWFSLGVSGAGSEISLSRLCLEITRVLQDFFTLSQESQDG